MSATNFVRHYRCPDSQLKQKADLVHDLTERDQTEFLTRAVNDTTRTNFQTMIDELVAVPTDVYMRGMLRLCTDTKEDNRRLLLNACGTIRTMSLNKWGEFNPKYTIYGWEGMSELPDFKLVSHASMVVYVAAQQLADGPTGIVTEGLTQAMIDNVSAKNTTFDDDIDKVRMAEKDRNMKAQLRITTGNTVFKEFTRLCNIGKELFHDTDPARYNDYLIGMLSVKPGDKFGSIGGTVTHSSTHQPLSGAQVTLKGEDLPDVVLTTDSNGQFAEDHVLTTYTTIEATMLHFQLFTAPLVIPPDDELLLDIALVPSP